MEVNSKLDFPGLTGIKINENNSIIGDVNVFKSTNRLPSAEEVENFLKELDGEQTAILQLQQHPTSASFACQHECAPKEEMKLFNSIYASQFKLPSQNNIGFDTNNYPNLLLNKEHHVEVKKEINNTACEDAEKITLQECQFQPCEDDDVQATQMVLIQNKATLIETTGYIPLPSYQQREEIISNKFHLQQDEDGDSPLHIYVAKCEHTIPETMKSNLFKQKESLIVPYVNSKNNLRQTPLHLAVEMGNVSMVQLLLECGAHVGVFDDHLESPLHTALRCKSKNLNKPQLVRDMVELLLDSVDMKSQNSLIDAKNNKGLSPIHLAMMRSDLELIKMLYHKGANINEQENKSGLTPLMLLIKQANNKQNPHASLQLAQSVINQLPVDVNIASYSKDTALHMACACDYLPLVEALIDKGAVVNEKNISRKNEKDLTTKKEIKDFLEIHYRKKRRKRKHGDD